MLLIEHLRAHDVGGQQVRRELDALKRGADRLRERAHGERLREAGHPFEQHVPASQQADEQPLDHVILPDDASPDLLHHTLDERSVGCRRRVHARDVALPHGPNPHVFAPDLLW